MSNHDEQPISCSFCKKRDDQVQLIAGPGVYICRGCVQACSELFRDQPRGIGADELSFEELPTPAQIKSFMDGYIIGQDDAKIALAVAVYNHYNVINFADLTTKAGIEESDMPLSILFELSK